VPRPTSNVHRIDVSPSKRRDIVFAIRAAPLITSSFSVKCAQNMVRWSKLRCKCHGVKTQLYMKKTLTATWIDVEHHSALHDYQPPHPHPPHPLLVLPSSQSVLRSIKFAAICVAIEIKSRTNSWLHRLTDRQTETNRHGRTHRRTHW